jgi:dTDP-4-amino-4,6-dideoxygalactose transaminase
VAASQLLHIESRASMHAENSAKWVEALGDLDLVQPMVRRAEQPKASNSPIRYPVMVPQGSELRNQLYKELTLAGLGVSCSYPRILPSYKEIDDKIISSEQVGASKVADQILTLPVHRNVKDRDIELTVQIIKKAIQR